MDLLAPFRDERYVDDFLFLILRERGLFSSDGMPWFRIVREDATSLAIVGRLVEVTRQTNHLFWLELSQTPEAGVAWTLRFDVVKSIYRGPPEDVGLLLNRVDDATWAHCVTGAVPSGPPER